MKLWLIAVIILTLIGLGILIYLINISVKLKQLKQEQKRMFREVGKWHMM